MSVEVLRRIFPSDYVDKLLRSRCFKCKHYKFFLGSLSGCEKNRSISIDECPDYDEGKNDIWDGGG